MQHANKVEPRRRLRPLIAAKNLFARLAALDALDDFRRAYALARERFVAGERDVAFPFGTWLIVERWGAELTPS
jgi:putative transposase